jgi:hypothetical protein
VLGDLVGCGSPLQIAKGLVFFLKAAKWPLYVVCSGLPHLTQQMQIKKKTASKGCYNLQRPVLPDWLGTGVAYF